MNVVLNYGEQIKDGNTYIFDITNFIVGKSNVITMSLEKIHKNNLTKIITRLSHVLDMAKKQYVNKTEQQMCSMLCVQIY